MDELIFIHPHFESLPEHRVQLRWYSKDDLLENISELSISDIFGVWGTGKKLGINLGNHENWCTFFISKGTQDQDGVATGGE
jgi:hypothetical protein